MLFVLAQALTKTIETSRGKALLCIALMYVVVQLLSFLILQTSGSYSVGDTWLHGAFGPLSAIKAIPRFRYHSIFSNFRFVVGCLLILAVPFAYVVRPRRATLVLSGIGVIVWCLFGLGFSINHI